MSEQELLYPVCPECGATEGIHKAILSPADAEGMHTVNTQVLACGHDRADPDMRLSEGVVSLFQMQHPEYIEVEA